MANQSVTVAAPAPGDDDPGRQPVDFSDDFWQELDDIRGVGSSESSKEAEPTNTFPAVSSSIVDALREAFPLPRYRLPFSRDIVSRDSGRQDVIEFLAEVVALQKAKS